MNARVSLCALVLILAGCVPKEPEMTWSKSGATEADRYNDAVACLKDAWQAAPAYTVDTRKDFAGLPMKVAPYDGNAETRQNLVLACMRVHGYSQVPAGR